MNVLLESLVLYISHFCYLGMCSELSILNRYLYFITNQHEHRVELWVSLKVLYVNNLG